MGASQEREDTLTLLNREGGKKGTVDQGFLGKIPDEERGFGGSEDQTSTRKREGETDSNVQGRNVHLSFVTLPITTIDLGGVK